RPASCTEGRGVRNARIHVARASTRGNCRSSIGLVCARYPVLRNAHGASTVPLRRSRYLARNAAYSPGAAPELAAQGLPPRGRTHHRAPARERHPAPLPRRPSLARRAQGLATVVAVSSLG